MSKNYDLLEIMEFCQLHELVNTGFVSEKWALDRLEYLNNKYSKEDVESFSITYASQMFSETTGYLRRQKCTNKDCGYIFTSQDISETCDICYHPTLRVVK